MKIKSVVIGAAIAAVVPFAASGIASAANVAHKPTVTFGAKSVSPLAAVHTLTTQVTAIPDSGFDGNTWGYDTFKMTFTWTRVKQVPISDCDSSGIKWCYLYDWSAKDAGTTETIEGQESPGQPFTTLDVVENANLTATESGQYYDSWKRVYLDNAPTSFDANGTASGTYYNDIGNGTWFTLVQPHSASVNITANTFAWTFSYDVPKGNDSQCPAGTWKWTDAYNVSEANSGNILAPNAADCAAQS